MPERLPPARRLAYSLGAGGYQIGERIVVVMAVYFYLPPSGRGLEAQVPEGVRLGFLTLFGLAMLVGRVFDSAADPFVGFWSDRSRSRLGRRRSFMLYGVAPMVVAPMLLFWPPAAPGSPWNALWLAALLVVYFVAFTAYVAPYLALLPELARSQEDRVRLGRWVALAALPFAIAVGVGWPYGFDLLRGEGLDAASALRWLVVGASVVSLLLCLAPILAVDERRFARSLPSDLPLGRALSITLASRPFRLYLGAQLFFLFGFNLIQPSGPYIATALLGRSEGFAATLGLFTVVGVALGFAVQSALVRRLGPKRAMMAFTALFAAAMLLLGGMRPDVPGGPHDAMNLTLAFAALGMLGLGVAGLAVIPHVILGQLIDADEQITGANRSAIFYGVQGLLTKWMYGLGLWAFTFLLARFGNGPDQPLGVLLVGPVGGAALAAAVVVYGFYPEREVLAAARRSESGTSSTR